MTKFSVLRRPLRSALCFNLTLFSVILTTVFLTSFRSHPLQVDATQRIQTGKVKCINIVRTFGGAEGIGAMVRRTQFAFFVASVLKADIKFPDFKSAHGYALQDIFSQCPEAKTSCHLSEEDSIIARCPRGDCECLKRNIAPRLLPLARNCPVINVENVRDRTTEYSGCINHTVRRYLSISNPPWKKLDYDALHFRQGDLADKRGGKAYHDVEMKVLLKQMCISSNRDIVIVTEGAPKIPVVEECGDRLVLAGDTSIQEAFGIFQHAKHVSLGSSSFAGLMAEVVRPQRMVVVERAVGLLEWVDCEKWTVMSNKYSVFHFDSKEMMVDAVMTRSLQFRSYYTGPQKKRLELIEKLEVPRRRWSNDTSWILTRREDHALNAS